VLVISFGLPIGIYGGWGVVLDLNLSTIGIGQHDAAMIGFYAMTAGCFAGMALGWVADRVPLETKQQYGGLKLFIVLLYIGALGFFGWFALLCCGNHGDGGGSTDSALIDADEDNSASYMVVCGWFPYSLNRVYWACIGGGLCINAVIPLIYELSMETTWPIAEGSVCGFLVLASGTLQSIFLFIPIGSDTQWMNWTLAGTFPLVLALLLPFAEKYPRLERDHNGS
jgi:MFS transporter, FLVCR family, disrupted in renal carcinoma protein 2